MEAVAKLKNCKGSPRKMRLIVDTIRGDSVENALHKLKFCPKKSAIHVEKLLLSAVANWQAAHAGARMEDAGLFVKNIFVDGGRTLKRWRPATRGSAFRIRKRTNHVTIVLDSANQVAAERKAETAPKQEEQNEGAEKQ